MRCLAVLSTLILFSLAAESTSAVVVSVPNRKDQVFDDSRGLLYLSTSSGTIQRYNPVTNTLLPSWIVGTDIGGIDITPDNHYLLTTEGALSGGLGVIHRVDLNDGSVTNLTYVTPGSRGSTDLVTLNDGRAIFSSGNQFSSIGTAMKAIDLSTFGITDFIVNGNVVSPQRDEELWRNRTRNTVAMVDTQLSSGSFSVFSTTTENWLGQADFGTPLNGMRIAITPNSAAMAMAGFNVTAAIRSPADLSVIHSMTDGGGGFAYDPTGTFLYDGSLNANAILIYRASDYQQVGSIAPAGASLNPFNVPGNGMTVSGDGKYLFLYSSNGLNVYAITPAPEAASVAALSLGLPLLSRRRRRSAPRTS